MIRVGIMTVADQCANGEREDVAGAEAHAYLPADDYEVFLRVTVPQDEGEVAMQLVAMCEAGCDVVLTTGGVGFSPRDITPEATVSILDRNAPGIAEALRAGGHKSLGGGMLNRGVAGVHDQTLIVNLPGNPLGVRDAMQILIPLLPRLVSLLRGETIGSA
jgi:molybdopterin adenylyltransferase